MQHWSTCGVMHARSSLETGRSVEPSLDSAPPAQVHGITHPFVQLYVTAMDVSIELGGAGGVVAATARHDTLTLSETVIRKS